MVPPPGRGPVFGQAMEKKAKGKSNYQRQFGSSSASTTYRAPTTLTDEETKAQYRRRKQAQGEAIDESFGVERFAYNSIKSQDPDALTRRGWLYNVMATTVSVAADASTAERSGLDLFFCTESGNTFKSTVLYRPYFYLMPDLSLIQDASQSDVVLELLISHLNRLLDGTLSSCHVEHKLDLDQPNHLSPTNNKHGRPLLKLTFDNVSQLMEAREQLRPIVQASHDRRSNYTFAMDPNDRMQELWKDPLQIIIDMREYDVPYVVRVCTDLEIRAGTWYTVQVQDALDASDSGGVTLLEPDRESKADPTFLAFDIECTKAPLKFPTAEVDEIFMISYMVSTPTGGQGYLITSRSVVSQDVRDFEYTPKPNYPGPFTIFNEPDEKALLERFFDEYRKHRPHIVVTYNGDFFDWPFVDARAQHHGINLFERTGVEKVNDGYRGRSSVHLDAFHWVQRDSYLPQGAQGLKAVTKYKLGYDPVEVDPEDMMRFAQERPVHMATYSVSDAVSTYYLHEKYVHLFIFSLCTIIPMGPEDVLGKGSGTLCEALLMVQACKKGIICPNKQVDPLAKFHNGHLLESETYIGGKVECLETGVYRSDLEYDFDLKPAAFDQLIGNIDRDLSFAIEVEGEKSRKDIVNYDEIRSKIIVELENLRDRPKRRETPYVYHLDVGAMYPNIILSNRLQPSAIVDDATCAACDFNQAKNNCKRRMDWVWRGDYNPATKNDYDRTRDQLAREVVQEGLMFNQIPQKDQAALVSKRLKEYSRNVYKKTKVTEEVTRQDVVCMRENDFYVDTVRQFRDRRYEYKSANKAWKKKVTTAKDAATKKFCEDKVLVYDSLQVAHKCILNSFYGYVMRKGARWRSMEMAGIVTKTGSDIITQARKLVEQIGRPLELDTDGIWCILPGSFPDVYTFELADGSKLKLEYPCVMLNAAVHDTFTNHQYQTLVDPERGIYDTHSECSIFFEVDGPYRCMFLPASTEEGKLLKKRYAVFNFDKSLAELKGFELKRRGELELIKTFQSQVFERFLDGETLEECYHAAADVANHWLDVIDTRGESLDDDELVDLVCENKNMSRQLDDYGAGQKGTALTTARRLGDFLGAEVIKDKGLNCKFIIAEQPYGAPVTDRAIPMAIWSTEPAVMKHFLRKWLKSPGLDGDALDIRNILDWDYYLERLSNTIRKIITIPAALQKIPNPVPRVAHPAWLDSKINTLNDRFKQKSLDTMFQKVDPNEKAKRMETMDIEDFGTTANTSKRPVVHVRRRLANQPSSISNETEPELERVQLSKENFPAWLQSKKASWRRSRREKTGERGTEKRPKTAVTIEGFVQDAAKNMASREWHVLEIRGTSGFDTAGQVSKLSTSGNFTVFVMVGSQLQRIKVSVPRIFYISARTELETEFDGIMDFKRVEKHLPHNKTAPFVYEVTMPEYIFQKQEWINGIRPVDTKLGGKGDIFETMFESGVPLLQTALCHIGSVSRLSQSATGIKGKKTYSFNDLIRVERPSEGEYLSNSSAYKRHYLYVRMHPRSKTGLVCLYILEGVNETVDVSRPSESGPNTLDVGATCHLWIIKPGSQKNVSTKQCQRTFQELLGTIEEASEDTEYACVSSMSDVRVASLNFVENEQFAYAGVNETLSGVVKVNHGPTIVMLTTSKPTIHLRRYISTLSSLPIVPVPFPPGPLHNPALSILPTLNWELQALQLGLEAYLFSVVVAFPKRVSYARYAQIPLGNLGEDENVSTFETSLSRMLQKNRALSWASSVPGRPNLGVNFLPSSGGGMFPLVDTDAHMYNQDEIWGDDDLLSPVVRRPGCYRSVCIDIDVQDLAIAALTDMVASMPALNIDAAGQGGGEKLDSPNSVAQFDFAVNGAKVALASPLGDEQSTSVSLPLVRSLVCSWLKDAFTMNSLVADELLHHIYRLLSNPDSLLHDPALHRVLHGLMKSTFLRLLGELQRLGCVVLFASFTKITIATNKIYLSEAEEYVDFVVSTIRKRASENPGLGDALARIALRPTLFHSQLVFLDEFNHGSMILRRMHKDEVDDQKSVIVPDDNDKDGSVVIAMSDLDWSLINYFGSDIAQEYFKIVIGRFSKSVLEKQVSLEAEEASSTFTSREARNEQLLIYRKMMVSKHFASLCTRAVDDILKDEDEDRLAPPLTAAQSGSVVPALEFIKNVVAVLELDNELETEVAGLKRSLLAQLGVAEYAKAASWTNPCPSYVLPDVFCSECNESKDLNVCYVPPRDPEDEEYRKAWVCDCEATYDVTTIEKRLISKVYRKVAQYQLQDLRCVRTNRVATRALAPFSDCSAGLKLDISAEEIQIELELLLSLSKLHDLDALNAATTGLLASFRV